MRFQLRNRALRKAGYPEQQRRPDRVRKHQRFASQVRRSSRTPRARWKRPDAIFPELPDDI